MSPCLLGNVFIKTNCQDSRILIVRCLGTAQTVFSSGSNKTGNKELSKVDSAMYLFCISTEVPLEILQHSVPSKDFIPRQSGGEEEVRKGRGNI